MYGRSLPKFITSLMCFLLASIIIPAVLNMRPHRAYRNEPAYDSAAPAPAEEAVAAAAPESPSAPVLSELFYADAAGAAEENSIDEYVGTETDEEQAYYPMLPEFNPYATDITAPGGMLASDAIMADGRIVDSYEFTWPIDFGYGDTYTELEGIFTFRGNNFRDSAAYGYAEIQDAEFGDKWNQSTGSLTAPDGAYWSGHGWSGQPLIVKWPRETREAMDMYAWAQEQYELVEVVYPSMDGFIYFNELETGKATRDKLYIGFTFKGTGSVDPRGYPLLYVGAGYGSSKGAARIFVISLIDGSVLYTFGSRDSFAHRSWSAADAAPLIDARTDSLIYPSENGVVYIIKLNSSFDAYNGVVKIEPDEPVKWRYKGIRSQSGGKYWLGIEASPAIWRGYLFIADNGGHLICLDLNTLTPVWVKDVLDDTNNSPVIEIEDSHPYIYISTGFHGGWRAGMGETAPVPIWKIDAVTGETVWQTEYLCRTSDGVSGGVQGTIAVGRNSLEGLIFVPVARTPNAGSGILAALDKTAGEVVWELRTPQYSWSSPVCVYDADGNGYIVYCTSGGVIYLVDGLTGELRDSYKLGGVIEASPAVYGNRVVVGTRAMKIWGIELK